MARLTAPDGRSRIPLLIAVAVLVIAVIGGGAFLLGRNSNPAAVSSTEASEPAPSPTDSVIYEGSYDPAPTGCLGGEERTPQMVLTAQKKAGHSAFGAVEVAAAIFRWGYRYPYPNASEVRDLRPVFSAGRADALEKQFISSYERSGYVAPPGGDVAAGTSYYLTTANGVWTISSDSTSDRVISSIQLHYVVNDSYSTSKTVAVTVVLQWSNARWRLADLRSTDPAQVTAGGTSFTTGC